MARCFKKKEKNYQNRKNKEAKMAKVCRYASASQENDLSGAVVVVEWIDSCLSDLGSIPLGENKRN